MNQPILLADHASSCRARLLFTLSCKGRRAARAAQAPTSLQCTAFALLLFLAFSLLVAALPLSAQQPDLFTQGLAAFQSGDYASAALLFAKAESAAPGTSDALLFEAKARVHLEQFSAADTALRNYLQSHPDSGEALYLLGFVLHRENRAADSLELYTRAAQRRPPTGDDLKVVGLNYILLNDYPNAIKWLEEAVIAEPRNKEAWYFLGRAYYTRSRIAEARKAFLKVLEIDPRDTKAENNLGLVYESQAQTDAAIAAYRQAIEWQEAAEAGRRPSEQPYLNLGSLLLEQARQSEAILPLQKAVELAPADPICHMRLGMAYLRSGKLADAQPQLEEAVRLAPDDPAGHYQLGKLYKELKQKDRAKAEFEKTEELQRRESSKKPH